MLGIRSKFSLWPGYPVISYCRISSSEAAGTGPCGRQDTASDGHTDLIRYHNSYAPKNKEEAELKCEEFPLEPSDRQNNIIQD